MSVQTVLRADSGRFTRSLLALAAAALVAPAVGMVGTATAHATTDACGTDIGSDNTDTTDDSGDTAAGVIRPAADLLTIDPGDGTCAALYTSSGDPEDDGAQVGDTLTARYRRRCCARAVRWSDDFGFLVHHSRRRGCRPVPFGAQITGLLPGASGTSTYKLRAGDKGDSIGFCVTLSADGYLTDVTSSDSVEVFQPWTVVNKRATVSGIAKVGQQLLANLPTMKPVADDESVQWLRGDSEIDGATSATYTVKPADVGKKLSFTVTLSLDGYADQNFDSNAVGPVNAASKTDIFGATPKIAGAAAVGKTLKAIPGKWKTKDVTLKYQWFAGKKPINGATTAKYKVTKKVVGKRLRVVVTGTKTGFTTTKTSSAPTKPVKQK